MIIIIDSTIKRVLDSGWYILGQEVESFEKEFSKYIGVNFAVGVASGTDALEISLRSMDIGRGDVVFTVSHTAVATVSAIERAGAIPYLVDIDPATYTIDVNKLETAIKLCCTSKFVSQGGRPKAIIPVHLYGHPADMTALMAIANRYNLRVIEDCAQAHGAQFMGKKVGSFGSVAAFSFYPTKNLGAFGDGGMVVTDNFEYYGKLRALRQYGWENRYRSSFSGINSRLDELQAGILRVKLLKSNSIAAGIHYPAPIHLQPAYRDRIPIAADGLEQTESICPRILSLPMYPQMTVDSVNHICETLETWPG